MPDLRQDLERIEDGIRKLKIQYELYFVGAEKLPPTKLHEDLDKQVKKFANMNFQRPADRFYFNNVQTRYNTYSELWNKQLRMKEEGRLLSGRPAVRSVSTNGREAAPAATRAASPARQPSSDGAVIVSLDAMEDRSLRRLHERFGAARAQSGQGEPPAYERFRDQVRAQLEALRQKGVSGKVEFRISVQNGKVSLKAKPVG